jgi:hypothetical protein
MINKQFKDGVFVKGEATVCVASAIDIAKNKDTFPFVHEVQYINFLPFDVSIVMRNGLRFNIPFVPSYSDKTFIVRDKYTIDHSLAPQLERLLAVECNCELPDLIVLAEAYQNSKKIRNSVISLVIDTHITADNISFAEGNMYVTNKDIVISKADYLSAPAHPFGTDTLVVDKYKALIDHGGSLSMMIEIIDNNGQISDRFFNLAGELHLVRPRVDRDRVDGVYFGTVKVSGGVPSVVTEIIDLEEAQSRLGLFRTREDAISFGDVEGKRKEEMQRLSMESTKQKLINDAQLHDFNIEKMSMANEFAMLEINHKKELLETNKSLEQAKLELEKSKLESAELDIIHKREKSELEHKLLERKDHYEDRSHRRDDYYEERSHGRKDTSEIIKFIPGAIALVALGFALFK